MARKPRTRKERRQISAEALRIANAQKIEGQTKEQTKVIARGVQKGIEQYLREVSEKARDLDRRSKKLKKQQADVATSEPLELEAPKTQRAWLPWSLLALSWLLIGFLLMRLVNP